MKIMSLITCPSKPIIPSFIVRTQIKIFWWNLRAFWACIDTTQMVQKGSKDIVKIVSDVSGSTLMLWSYENTFLRKENENNDFLQQFLLFYVSLRHAFRKVKITITATILASTPMHNNVLPLCSFKCSSSVNLDGFWLVSIIYHFRSYWEKKKFWK